MSLLLDAALGCKSDGFVENMRVLENLDTRAKFGGQWVILSKGKILYHTRSVTDCADYARKNALRNSLRAFVEPLKTTQGGVKMPKVREYVAVAHKDEDSDYGISFPSVPGCVTAVKEWDDAFEAAEEVLRIHLQEILDMGEDLPASNILGDLKTKAFGKFLISVKLDTEGLI